MVRSVPFVVILAVGACSPPAPPPDPFASSGGATDPSLPGCGSCFVVDRDNPVFRATDFRLRGGESVTRGAQEVSYTNFLIEPVFSLGNVGRGADAHPYLPLFAEPGSLVTYFPGDAYPFEIHGVEAGYAPLGVFANYRDLNNGGFGIPNATFQVQLSPKTILVPFYVVRAMSKETGTPFGQQINAQLGKYSVASYKQLFDDQTPVSVLRKSHPDEPNAGTDYAYLSNSGTTDQILTSAPPDDVWAQCGIQFRMVPCDFMEFGCPDLLTDNATLFPKCDSLTDAHQRALRDLAKNLPGVRLTDPLVCLLHTAHSAFHADATRLTRADGPTES